MKKLYATAALALGLASGCGKATVRGPMAVEIVKPIIVEVKRPIEVRPVVVEMKRPVEIKPVVIDIRRPAEPVILEVAKPKPSAYEAPKRNPKFFDGEGKFRWYIKDSEFADKAEMNAYHVERANRDVNAAIGPARKPKKAKTLDEIAREKGW